MLRVSVTFLFAWTVLVVPDVLAAQDDESSPSDRVRQQLEERERQQQQESESGESIVPEFDYFAGCDTQYLDQLACGVEDGINHARCMFNRCTDHWQLMEINNGAIDVGGWIASGVTVSDHNVGFTTPVPFVNPTDELLLNQLWVYAGREADIWSCNWDWGFRIDYVFGADGPDTQAFGSGDWDFGWITGGTGGNTYGSAIPQLYFEVASQGLSVKLGHFFTTIGYEGVAAPDNFFYTRSYTMNYGEPFTHTGLLAEFEWNQYIKLLGGYTFGWDSGFSNLLRAHTFLGGVQLQLADHVAISYMTNAGDFGDGTAKNNRPSNVGDIYVHSIVAEIDLSSRLHYVIQSDYGRNSGLGSPNNRWYGINQYLFYHLNECWSGGMRFEAFRDHAGTTGRIAAVGETYQAWTLGLNWRPHPNIVVRPEVRWDWVNGGSGAFSGNNSLFTSSIDAIFRF